MMEYDERALEACTHYRHLRLRCLISYTVISVYPFSHIFSNLLYDIWAGWVDLALTGCM